MLLLTGIVKGWSNDFLDKHGRSRKILQGFGVELMQGSSKGHLRSTLEEEKLWEPFRLIEELNEVMEEGEAWRERYQDSEAAVHALTEELRKLIGQQRSSQEQDRDEGDFLNTGKLFDNLSSMQQRRKLSQLETSDEKALWFIDSFGLDVKSIALETSHGNQLNISFGAQDTSTSCIND